MANFQNFELNNSELIFGGDIQSTEWSGSDGSSGTDYLDTDRGRIVYPA